MINDLIYGLGACVGIAAVTGAAVIALLLLFYVHNPRYKGLDKHEAGD